jgi:hypothetical protein
MWIDVAKFAFAGLHNLKVLLSQGDYTIFYDITSRFSHTKLHPSFRMLACFRWRNKLYVYYVLPFGLRNTLNAFSKTVSLFIARWRQPGIKVLPYLDDFFFSRHL